MIRGKHQKFVGVETFHWNIFHLKVGQNLLRGNQVLETKIGTDKESLLKMVAYRAVLIPVR